MGFVDTESGVARGDYQFLTEAHPRHKPSAFNFMEEIGSCENKTAKMEQLLHSDDIGPRLRAVLISRLRPNIIDAKFYNRAGHPPERASLGIEPDSTTTSTWKSPTSVDTGTTWTSAAVGAPPGAASSRNSPCRACCYITRRP